MRMEFVSGDLELLPRAVLDVLSPGELETLHYAGPYHWILSSDALRVSIVGTRKASPMSLEGMRSLARKLSQMKCTIVSGGAVGTDMAAHMGALEWGGPTIACAPFGLEGLNLGQWRPELLDVTVEDSLLLLSQFHPRQETDRQTPVVRNRLIAALAEVLVIGEAPSGSGTFHCVAKAQKLGVPVFFLKYQDLENPASSDLTRLHRNLEKMRMEPFYLDECGSDQLCRRIYDRGIAYRRDINRSENAQADLFDMDDV